MVNLFVLILWLLVIPLCIGGIPAAFVDKQEKSPAFMCIMGYMIMWALFQVICVPCVLLQEKYDAMFPAVVYSFGTVAVLLALAGIFAMRYAKRKLVKIADDRTEGKMTDGSPVGNERDDRPKMTVGEKTAWCIFALLVLIQLAASVFMTYGDGDDAFYVAVSTITESSNTLYKILPYSMGETGLDIRHGLAPFPIWIAFLARVSGFKAVFVAHVAVGTFLIGLTYVIYYKIGKILFHDRRETLPIFLNFTALLVLFGDYSYKTPENFMIARSRQGKAALGSIIVPVVILLLLMIFRQIQEKKKEDFMLWILLCAAVAAACLCSTLGTFLMCLLLGCAGVCAGVVYRKLKILVYMAACCMPALACAAMYFLLV